MNKLTDRIKRHQFTALFRVTFVSRLGGIAGLLGVVLAWVVGLILLYPTFKTFEAFKHRMPTTSVWRML